MQGCGGSLCSVLWAVTDGFVFTAMLIWGGLQSSLAGVWGGCVVKGHRDFFHSVPESSVAQSFWENIWWSLLSAPRLATWIAAFMDAAWPNVFSSSVCVCVFAFRYACIIDSTLLWCVCVCVCLSSLGVYINNSRRRQRASSRNAQLGVFQGLVPMVMSQSFAELL